MNSCGDWGSAYQLPGCSRTGTRKSLAPSGVDLVRNGVSTFTKLWSRMTSLTRYAALERALSAAAISARLMSRYRYLRRTSSFSSACPSIGNGSGSDSARISIRSAATSTSPVGSSGFSFPAGLRLTSPATSTQNSARSSCATSSSRTTTWTTPLASRRSMKTTPP